MFLCCVKRYVYISPSTGPFGPFGWICIMGMLPNDPKRANIWRFPKMGAPQIIQFNRTFHEINHPAIKGYPIYGNLHISYRVFVENAQWKHIAGSTDLKLFVGGRAGDFNVVFLLSTMEIWLRVWNHGILWLSNTFHISGMSSSQLTFIFFRGFETTNYFLRKVETANELNIINVVVWGNPQPNNRCRFGLVCFNSGNISKPIQTTN